ncbi:hypothetical protein C8F01DRAFT_543319 [Mycena amicta]|nr:hypothetical protein C8F01DRAFT_543319 [Mycena amicta]
MAAIVSCNTRVSCSSTTMEAVLDVLFPSDESHSSPTLSAPPLDYSSPEIDINDTHREKIVIRPKSKAYVQKQRAAPTLRTLSCFSTKAPSRDSKQDETNATKSSAAAPSMWIPGPEDTIIVKKRKKLAKKSWRQRSKSPLPNDSTGGISSLEVAERHKTPDVYAAPLASPRKPLVGRIEKRSPPTAPRALQGLDDLEVISVEAYASPTNAMEVVSVFAAAKPYCCGCSTPTECLKCSLVRLTDQFCAIVTERKERLRLQGDL